MRDVFWRLMRCRVTCIAFSISVIMMLRVVRDTLYVAFIDGKAGVMIGK